MPFFHVRNDKLNIVKGSILPLKKRKKAKYAFDDGLIYKFNDEAQPRHVQFWCKTDNSNAESCNLRLYKQAKVAVT